MPVFVACQPCGAPLIRWHAIGLSLPRPERSGHSPRTRLGGARFDVLGSFSARLMTRHVHNSRIRKVALLAVAAVAVAGLAAPIVFDTSISDLSLNTAAVIAATRDSYTLTSPVPLPLLPNVMIEAGRLSVAGTEAIPQPTGAEALALLTAGKAKIVLDDAVLSIAPTQSAETAAPGEANALAPVLLALTKLSFSSLEMRNALVQLGRGGESQGTLSDVTLDVTKIDSSKARAIGSFVYRKRPVKFDIVMGTQAELQDGTQKAAATIGRTLAVAIESELLNLKADGTLSAGDQPQLTSTNSTVIVSDLRRLARWIGVDLGKGPGLGPFEARGPLEFSSNAIAFSDATFVVDGNEATGALSLRWGGLKRPSIDGTLAFKTLDIAPIVRGATLASGPTDSPFRVADYFNLTDGRARVLPLVDQIDADLRISAASVASGATRFGRGAASLSLKDGILLADLAELELGKGGRCGGQFGFEVRDGVPHYALRGKLESIDLAAISHALWAYNVLSGAGDMTLDIKASGEQSEQILSSMGGKISLSQPGSGQIGLDLKTLAATTRAQVQTGWGGATRGQTAIEGLSAEFSMIDGRLIAKRVNARAGDASLSAVGSVSFPDSAGDVKVWITHPANGTHKVDDTASTLAVGNAANTGSAVAAEGQQPAANAAAGNGTRGAPGGGLHMLGPLVAPEIRFLPLNPPPSSDAREPVNRPAPPAVPDGKG